MIISRSKQDCSHLSVSLRFVLDQLTVASLNELVDLLTVKKRPTRKTELVGLIENYLLGDSFENLWDRFDETQQQAVSETLYTYGGLFDSIRFKAKYDSVPSFYQNKSNKRYGGKPGILQLLMFREDRYKHSHLVIPRELQERLHHFVPEPTPIILVTTKNLPSTKNNSSINRSDTENSALQDLKSILRLISQGKVSVSNKTFRASKATTKTIAKVLRNGDFYSQAGAHSFDEEIGPIKSFAWPLLIQATKFAGVQGSKLVLTKAGQKALVNPPAESIKLIWTRWIKNKLIDEFNRIDAIKGQKGKGKRSMTSASERRSVISHALSNLQVDQWVNIDVFSNFMQSENYLFEITKSSCHLYLCDPQYGNLGYEGYHGWSILQGRYIQCLLLEYAATLGLIDVAYTRPENAESDFSDLWGADELSYLSRYDGLLYLRLTSLGAYCLGLTASFEQSETKSVAKITVLPNLQVTTEVLAFEHSQLLETYADKISEQQWRLNPDKMITAVENGHKLSELETFLTENNDQLLPETVEALIKKIDRQARSLIVKGPTVLIECADAEVAKMVSEHEQTKSLCMLAGDKHLVLTVTEKAFRATLKKIGYGMPNV